MIVTAIKTSNHYYYPNTGYWRYIFSDCPIVSIDLDKIDDVNFIVPKSQFLLMNEIYTDLENKPFNNLRGKNNNLTRNQQLANAYRAQETTIMEGALTKFPTGAVRDTNSGKEDYVESLSFSALRRFAKYMKSKEGTYGPGNWKKGIPIESYEKSLWRHVQKYFANKYENANLEPDEDHLAGIWFNLQGIMHEELKGDSLDKA